MENVLEVKNLTKKYGKQNALEDVSLTIPKGSIMGLVGKNGAGKTTLMRVVTGLQKQTKGEYSILGVSDKDRAIGKQRRKIGALIEKPGLYFDLSARDNLKVQFINLGIPSFDEIDNILELVGLSNTGKKNAGAFSLGMRQRLGIAVALAGNPDLLILDEPINGLDPQGIVEIREILIKLNREKGTTILISSHILGELEHLATDYIFIDKGHIVQEISAEEMKKQCRKSTVLTVTGIDAICKTLDDLGIEYQISGEDTVTAYGDFNLSELVINASKSGAEIVKSVENNENLERYFLDMVEGK